MKEWRKKHPDFWRKSSHPELYRTNNLKHLYGITLENYERLYNRQEGHCAICDKWFPQFGKKGLGVDHDHTTGKIRGLLCNRCNMGIGCLADNIEILLRAIAYITKKIEIASSSM